MSDLATMLRHAPEAPPPLDLSDVALPCGDQVLIRPRPDVHKRLTSASVIDPTIDLSGSPDEAIILEVLSVGDGAVINGRHNPMPVKVGDVVATNGFFRGSRQYVERVAHYLFASEWLMMKIHPETLDWEPLPGYLVTKANDDRARVIMMGKAFKVKGGKKVQIHAPINDSENNGGDGFNEDDRRDPDKIRYEEVVKTGEGPLLADGTPQKARWRVGDMVSFSPGAVATSITIQGRSYTMMPWGHVKMALRTKEKR